MQSVSGEERSPSTTPQTRLLLVRHGETAHSSEDSFSGVTETPLTIRGHQQARALAEHLRDDHISVDVLYCSPQSRARDTARPLAEALKLKIQIREALREIDFGEWENRTRGELRQTYAAELDAWERGSWRTLIPGGETPQAVIARVVPCVIELLNQHAGQTIMLVSHRTTLRLLTGHILNMSLTASRSLRINTASLTELHITGDQAHLITFNDTRHLISL